jgi:hypothetical protein
MRPTLVFVLLSAISTRLAAAEERPSAETYLIAGDLVGGEKKLSVFLESHSDDGLARFGLGAIQFIRAVEHLIQGFYKHGLLTDPTGGSVPFARLPVPSNPRPEPIRHADLRSLFQMFLDDLGNAERTLAQVKDDAVKLPIRFGLVRLDFNGDGKAADDETLWRIYTRLDRRAGIENPNDVKGREFPIVFDRGDVAWLRGYTHLLMGLSEFYLAHDTERLFEHTAHRFFARPKTPFDFLKDRPRGIDPARRPDVEVGLIGDLAAFLHLVRFEVKEPARMKSVLAHLETMVALSRESWKFNLAETDNDHEWIPNPTQDTVVPGGKVTGEMVKGWLDFLAEAEAILAGKTLVPFWRDADGKGVNLHRVFTEPSEMDLVLWLQGTAAARYLEAGPVTKPEVWTRLLRVFHGEFIGFAIWFN